MRGDLGEAGLPLLREPLARLRHRLAHGERAMPRGFPPGGPVDDVPDLAATAALAVSWIGGIGERLPDRGKRLLGEHRAVGILLAPESCTDRAPEGAMNAVLARPLPEPREMADKAPALGPMRSCP